MSEQEFVKMLKAQKGTDRVEVGQMWLAGSEVLGVVTRVFSEDPDARVEFVDGKSSYVSTLLDPQRYYCCVTSGMPFDGCVALQKLDDDAFCAAVEHIRPFDACDKAVASFLVMELFRRFKAVVELLVRNGYSVTRSVQTVGGSTPHHSQCRCLSCSFPKEPDGPAPHHPQCRCPSCEASQERE